MEGKDEGPKTSLFPLLSQPSDSISSQSRSHWLCNPSFTADLSLLNDAVSSHVSKNLSEEDDDDPEPVTAPARVYQTLDSDDQDLDTVGGKIKKKKKRKHRRSPELDHDIGSLRRSNAPRPWSSSDSKPSNSKPYFFDSKGDPDNFVFGSLYRMDVARYKPYAFQGLSGLDFRGLRQWNPMLYALDMDSDVDALDNKLRSGGRYWSAKYMAVESQKSLKRLRIVAPKTESSSETVAGGDFIPLSDVGFQTTEESWEDELLRKTREFNKTTRERPHDEKAWLGFAEFQDKVAAMQSQKGARVQTLEKKISILEKAVELNPDNEQLLLSLLKAYRSRDNIDVFIGRFEKILVLNSGNYKLWKEFLVLFQGDFSSFKVSEMRKMYSNAIQALSAACSRHSKQVHHAAKSFSLDSAHVQLELGLVDIFLSLCRFEWQAGYQELATALFQAEIEYSLLCPSLLLTEQSKQRLFQHFWDSDGARVGEDGAFGWSTWLEKEEENRQRILKEEASTYVEEEGGWTGWSEPFAKNKISGGNPDNVTKDDIKGEEPQSELEDEDINLEDDTEVLLKKLGIDVDVASSDEVKDVSTWNRWSKEELSRDCDQWMPLRTKSGVAALRADDTPNAETDEQLVRVIMYEDVNEFLFSLSSSEARLSLLLQLINFFGGKISHWICTNDLSWIESTLSLEEISDSLLQTLAKVDNLNKLENSLSGSSLESLLGSTNDVTRRTGMMKFLRNVTLLCLTAFPRNYIVEEATLVTEELFVTKMNSDSCSVTPCRALAKRLLKNDRQDVLLCGVYARREAFYGNIDHARRVFDMALSSIEGLPLEFQSNKPLIYFWYAETELANNSQESSFRAIHILSCLGSGETYAPFKGQSSSMQLLRAHQGFKEKIRTVESAWVRGTIDDQSVSLLCSAAFFEELTSGWRVGIEVLDQAFTMVLPERRSHTYQIEFLFKFYVKMLQRHLDQLSPSKCWESICEGLQVFPFNTELCSALVHIGNLYTTPNKLRRMFDEYNQKKQSVVIWIFALSFEISRGGSQHRVRGLFERALGNDTLRRSVLLWRSYIAYEVNITCDPSAARRIFFRAIHACPWSKKLWMDGFAKLNLILSAKELSDLQEVMRDKELNLRTDIYEILLEDDFGVEVPEYVSE
ncbi:uncharacterized protein LOC133033621 isoform X2 [Cannabis sativa]|uniref:uncharacterized protein LOC133033621 isoform X2 n=1 Tax=Cannabis sativa TaxID=3483 RepID=UPI0029CA4E10|nr:uncharacterized protein LOC133033621 isoform X2 [Cannabis sativa]